MITLHATQVGCVLFFLLTGVTWVYLCLEESLSRRLRKKSDPAEIDLELSATREETTDETQLVKGDGGNPTINIELLRNCCRAFTEVGFLILVCWLCENKPLFPHGQRTYDRDHFWFIFCLFLVFSLGFIHKTSSSAVLNREITEEWKGWMQFLFVAYHYFHATELYNLIRVLVACYLWMTGFGNFSFFYMKKDFSFLRVARMLWRLNFLTILLCFAMHNSYSLYYITGLHTFFFFVVFGTMRLFSSKNDWQSSFMAGKMVLVAVGGYFLWDIPNVFDYTIGLLLPAGFTRHEAHFRSYLDHFSPFFGMAFAMCYPRFTEWIAMLDKLRDIPRILVKGALSGIIGGMLAAWCWWALTLDKVSYNAIHPYASFFPITAYCFLRNVIPSTRTKYFYPIAFLGKLSLETYLMQHHVFLTSNAKTLLVLIPDYPELNFLACCGLFLFLSWRFRNLTDTVAVFVLPNATRAALVNLGLLVFVLGSCLASGALLAGFSTSMQLGASVLLVLCLVTAFRLLMSPNKGAHRLSAAIFVSIFTVLVVMHGFAVYNSYIVEDPKPIKSNEEVTRKLLSWEDQESTFHFSRRLLADEKAFGGDDKSSGSVPALKTNFIGGNPLLGLASLTIYICMILLRDTLAGICTTTRFLIAKLVPDALLPSSHLGDKESRDHPNGSHELSVKSKGQSQDS